MKNQPRRDKDTECDECGKTFTTAGTLRVHKLTHLGQSDSLAVSLLLGRLMCVLECKGYNLLQTIYRRRNPTHAISATSVSPKQAHLAFIREDIWVSIREYIQVNTIRLSHCYLASHVLSVRIFIKKNIGSFSQPKTTLVCSSSSGYGTVISVASLLLQDPTAPSTSCPI